MSTIKMKTSDGVILTADAAITKKSPDLKEMVEKLDPNGDQIVHLPNIPSESLTRIIKWCDYYKEKPEPTNNIERAQRCVEDENFEKDFFRLNIGAVFELVRTSARLHMYCLYTASVKNVTRMMGSTTCLEVMAKIKRNLEDTPEH